MERESFETDLELAEYLYKAWNQGQGVAKSELERRIWNDGKSHGRRFDRYILQHLGISTNKPSRQTDNISNLKRQVRSLGAHPIGDEPTEIEIQLQHSREACLSALRIWNDPTTTFRTGAFSLLFVTAWNSLALAKLQRDGIEWRKMDPQGQPIIRDGVEQALATDKLIHRAFSDGDHYGLRENIKFWIDLRNYVAHHHLPVLDVSVIPYAQAGLLNFEKQIVEKFGREYELAERLSVPLQLSGFRDPDILTSRQRAQSSLPLSIQALLGRAAEATPELLADETFIMRVAFIPVVRSSNNSPDAVAYFVKPEEVSSELAKSLEDYVILPKASRSPRPDKGAKDVVSEVQQRIPFRFNTNDHANVTRHLKVRPERGQPDRSLNEIYCEYVSAVKVYLYNQAWIDRVVERIETPEGFREATGRNPVPKKTETTIG